MPTFTLVPRSEAEERANARLIQEYASYIEQLKEGWAGKLAPGEGETPLTIRRHLAKAAQITGRQVQIASAEDAVNFWLASEAPEADPECVEGIERGLSQMARGEGRPAEEVFAEFRSRHGIMNG